MLWLLKYIPQRYHPFFIEHGWIVMALAIFVAVAAPIMWLVRPDPYQTVGYVLVDVTSAMDVSGDVGFDRRFTFRDPEGDLIVLGTRSFAMASTVGDTACLQKRKHISGEISYALATPAKCEK